MFILGISESEDGEIELAQFLSLDSILAAEPFKKFDSVISRFSFTVSGHQKDRKSIFLCDKGRVEILEIYNLAGEFGLFGLL